MLLCTKQDPIDSVVCIAYCQLPRDRPSYLASLARDILHQDSSCFLPLECLHSPQNLHLCGMIQGTKIIYDTTDKITDNKGYS